MLTFSVHCFPLQTMQLCLYWDGAGLFLLHSILERIGSIQGSPRRPGSGKNNLAYMLSMRMNSKHSARANFFLEELQVNSNYHWSSMNVHKGVVLENGVHWDCFQTDQKSFSLVDIVLSILQLSCCCLKKKCLHLLFFSLLVEFFSVVSHNLTSIHGFASSTWEAGTGSECGRVISSGPNGAGTLGKSGGNLWLGDD